MTFREVLTWPLFMTFMGIYVIWMIVIKLALFPIFLIGFGGFAIVEKDWGDFWKAMHWLVFNWQIPFTDENKGYGYDDA
jgi:hypothetical protein